MVASTNGQADRERRHPLHRGHPAKTETRDVGADDVLKKPLSMRQLALSLSRALGQ
jgi:hypothetical protein